MNDLLSVDNNHRHVIEMAGNSTATPQTLEKFYEEVEAVKKQLKELDQLHINLRNSHEKSKKLHSAKTVKELRSKMDSDVILSLKKAKLIKSRLESLDRSNEASRSLPDCGPGSSSDRTRVVVVSGLRKNLKDSMESFNGLREQISSEYRETVQRRYFTVTGEKADDKTVDLLISTGESETFLQKAIKEQGRATVMETIQEIEERHGAVKEIERNLNELHQVFLDMAVLVEAQGEELNDIESQMKRANSYVRGGVQQLHVARRHQKNSRKWTCFAILLLLIIALVIILPIVLKNN
ncbi:syntaxin-121-like [Trifolium pratense]|uniref:syntaxin-121-like n=1 Tax=Trifolium pratense TaxID=57577 RepID=UPI001E697526|nr:syntaxin-121-like [Trifolium pratense]